MTDTAHAYAADLADKGFPLSHIARATGLTVQDLHYIRPKERKSYTTPVPAKTEEVTPRYGSKSARAVFAASCERLGVDPAGILGESHKRPLAWPRQEIMFDIFVSCPRMSSTTIGRMMNRDHTTVIHGVKQHCKRIGITYEEAVAMRVVASDGELSPEVAAQHINSSVFEAMMRKYGAAMGRTNG